MATSDLKFAELQVGEVIYTPCGNFVVKDFIAKGRCCATYEGENTGRRAGEAAFVALKLFSDHQEYRGALRRENMVLRALTGHRHIVRVLCEVQVRGCALNVQELLTGTAAGVMHALVPPPPSPYLVATLATHTARGLAALHGSSLVHGDVKMQNIMWSADRAAFVLIDFGLSTRYEEEYHHRVHSLEYSSPEVLTWNAFIERKETNHELSKPQQQGKSSGPGVGRPGPEADVWALGYLIARVMAGRRVFPAGIPEHQDQLDVLLDHLLASVSSHYQATFLAEVAAFIKRCLLLSPPARVTAPALCSFPWQCPSSHCPPYRDLTVLPTNILRINNISDPGQPVADVSSLLSECGECGRVLERRACADSGSLFVKYEEAVDAETALQELQGKTWRHRTLCLSFYPPHLYDDLL